MGRSLQSLLRHKGLNLVDIGDKRLKIKKGRINTWH